MCLDQSKEGTGSPPRVRGKEQVCRVGHPRAGITPACAGKSASSCLYFLTTSDHPRVCGEKKKACARFCMTTGSPPRVRGKAPPHAVKRRLSGITPACAGKRMFCPSVTLPEADHPRVCGEKDKWRELMHCPEGSPPRVRGKGLRFRFHKPCAGITPACAGKSDPEKRRTSGSGDHPRVCGEKHVLPNGLPLPMGSPPRVRGKD